MNSGPANGDDSGDHHSGALPRELQDALASLPPGDEAALAALCECHPAHATLLRDIAAELAAIDDTVPAQWVGPYRLLRVIDAGGMGVVWLAQREQPVLQRVAVKVIKLGMDTEAVVARFQQERQLLAHMEHDAIAKVLDCGATERGQPWFAMEFVPGEPITAFCDRHRLPIRERLQLLQQVCAAVTHAHQKSVIHRDLKPGNVLVGQRDGRPFVKVIDFGLAKALTPTAGDTEHPPTVGAVGTLEYMAPEQADAAAGDVDTRADVYALGVILHELLVGERPLRVPRREYESDQLADLLAHATIDRPSRRFAALAPDLAGKLATERATSATALRGMLERDLDWVVLKAIARRRGDRYDTPGALADELQRFLDHQPLHAGPPSTLYRLRKFGRRYRLQITAVTAVLLTAVIGAFVATTQAVAARRNLAAKQQQILLGELAALRSEADETLWWTDDGTPSVAALTDWLARANALEPRTSEWRARRTALLRRASPPTAEDLRRQHDRVPGVDLLQRLRAWCAQHANQADQDGTYTLFAARIAAFERELERHRVYRFASAADAAEWAEVDRVTREIDEFLGDSGAGTFASVQRRLAIAQRLLDYEPERQRRFLAIAPVLRAVAPDLDRKLAAVPGLVPLGQDPRSSGFEFCLLTTGSVPERDSDGRLHIGAEHGVVFVLLAGGDVVIGAQRNEPSGANFDPDAESDESPVHRLTLAPLLLGKFEMSQAIWLRLSGENPSFYARTPTSGDEITELHPVESIGYDAARLWLRRYGLDLPTEAQWEFAARSGSGDVRWPADPELCLHANVADQCAKERDPPAPWTAVEPWSDGFPLSAPVSSMEPNGFGLHHMLGNVWEWCRDVYSETAYRTRARAGDGLRSGNLQDRRVARGGSFQQIRTESRVANRGPFPKRAVFDNLGLRPLLPLPQQD